MSELPEIIDSLDHLPFELETGKVRYSLSRQDGKRALITTDRLSAFDYIFGTIPHKGRVLNQLAAWWFTQFPPHIKHHFIEAPHPNISVVKTVEILPIEIIVRGYLSGSTNTSAWYAYQHKNQEICGQLMPEGMRKNEPFAQPLITPTTKAAQGAHDEPISAAEILRGKLVDPLVWEQVEATALELFAWGQSVAAQQGLILVDTKYEMGLDPEGNLVVADEVHTPDSSRYWKADSYADRLAAGQEPEMLDKEFMRLWLQENGFDPNDQFSAENPSSFLTEELRQRGSQAYLDLYHTMTGQALDLGAQTESIEDFLARWY